MSELITKCFELMASGSPTSVVAFVAVVALLVVARCVDQLCKVLSTNRKDGKHG